MDTFSYSVFEPEAALFQLTPDAWEKELNNAQPDMLFVESTWRGKDDLWEDKINHLSDALILIVDYCKKEQIPTVIGGAIQNQSKQKVLSF